MASTFESPHIIQPEGEHTRTIILLHGRGSQGEEFSEELFEGKTKSGQTLLETFAPNTKWIFPSSRERYSTVFQEEMDEWFDIYSLSYPNSKQELQREGLKESVEFVHSLISEEISAGIQPKNIFLGGISQGFATAIHVLLSGPHEFGGFTGLCGWLPFSNLLPHDLNELKTFYQNELSIVASTTQQTLKTPVLVSHAKDDNTVEICLGNSAVESLKALGLEVEWHEYEEGEHWINEPDGSDDIASFIKKHV